MNTITVALSSLPQIKTRDLRTSSLTLLSLQALPPLLFPEQHVSNQASTAYHPNPKTLSEPPLQLPHPMPQWKKTKHKRGTKRKSRTRGIQPTPSPNIMARLLGRRGQRPRPRRTGPPLTRALIRQRSRALIVFITIVVAIIWQIVIIFHHLAHIWRFVRATLGETIYGSASVSGDWSSWKIIRSAVCTWVSSLFFFDFTLVCNRACIIR
jgi:hypothetical protein